MSKIKKWTLALGLVAVVTCLLLWNLTGKWMADGLTAEADGTNGYAIVLGAKVDGDRPSLSLRYRLDSALSYAEKYPEVIFILSGGQGRDEDVSEAEAMRGYLVEHGIDENRLMLESASTSTYENILHSKKLLPSGIESVTIITSDYHLARARFIAERLGLQTDGVGADTPKVVKTKSNVRERIALLKTFIVGK